MLNSWSVKNRYLEIIVGWKPAKRKEEFVFHLPKHLHNGEDYRTKITQ